MARRDRAEAIEDAAARVAGDLVLISSSLQRVVDRLTPPEHQGEREFLRDVIDRVDRCAQLLSVELDRPEPNHGFLRKALSVGVVAANLAASGVVGFAASEVSQHHEIRWPVEEVQGAAQDAEDAERAVEDGEQEDQRSSPWRIVDAPGGWQALLREPETVITTASRYDDGGTSVAVDLGVAGAIVLTTRRDFEDWTAADVEVNAVMALLETVDDLGEDERRAIMERVATQIRLGG